MFLKTMTAKVLLEGNGYARIHRDGAGKPIELELISLPVKMYIKPDRSTYYLVGYEGDTTFVDSEDMIHVMNFSYNGYIGQSTLTHAATTMGLATSAEKSAIGFYSSGANMSGILTVSGKLTSEKAQAIKDSWAAAFDVDSGSPGGIAVMEAGMEFKPVTVNPKDAQMLETRQFNVLEICRFFGVPPSKAFAQEGLTYSNVEAYQLGYITDTVTPMDTRFEVEFTRKLIMPSQRGKVMLELNVEALMKANLDSLANYYSKMFQSGGFTVNEIRQKLGEEKMPGGDEPMVQVNMQKLNKPDNGKGDKEPEQ
jgi:HK97 family phage portal protein